MNCRYEHIFDTLVSIELLRSPRSLHGQSFTPRHEPEDRLALYVPLLCSQRFLSDFRRGPQVSEAVGVCDSFNTQPPMGETSTALKSYVTPKLQSPQSEFLYFLPLALLPCEILSIRWSTERGFMSASRSTSTPANEHTHTHTQPHTHTHNHTHTHTHTHAETDRAPPSATASAFQSRQRETLQHTLKQ